MAKKKPLSTDARARALVKIERHTLKNAVTYTLPVNPDFSEETITRGGGVDYPRAPEIAIAERAIADVFTGEIGPLRAWIDWAAGMVGGGLAGLAAALLGLPLSAETRKNRAFKAELRKLEEYRQGKYKSVSKGRLPRLLAYNAKLLRQGDLHLKVLGDWLITSGKGGKPQVKHFHWWMEEDSGEARAVIAGGGEGFCGAVEYAYGRISVGFEVTLERVYALQIEYLKEE